MKANRELLNLLEKNLSPADFEEALGYVREMTGDAHAKGFQRGFDACLSAVQKGDIRPVTTHAYAAGAPNQH